MVLYCLPYLREGISVILTPLFVDFASDIVFVTANVVYW